MRSSRVKAGTVLPRTALSALSSLKRHCGMWTTRSLHLAVSHAGKTGGFLRHSSILRFVSQEEFLFHVLFAAYGIWEIFVGADRVVRPYKVQWKIEGYTVL